MGPVGDFLENTLVFGGIYDWTPKTYIPAQKTFKPSKPQQVWYDWKTRVNNQGSIIDIVRL